MQRFSSGFAQCNHSTFSQSNLFATNGVEGVPFLRDQIGAGLTAKVQLRNLIEVLGF